MEVCVSLLVATILIESIETRYGNALQMSTFAKKKDLNLAKKHR